jgi:cytochrome b6-f complex iron-sulfur subunit
MNRKEFFSKALIGGGLIFLAPTILNSCGKSEDVAPSSGGNNGGSNNTGTTIDLTSNDFSALKNVGGYAYSGDIIIIRTGTSTYIALSKICTHQNCTVAYNNNSTKIECPCHGSMFATTGAVLQGPAPSALKTYTVTLSGTTLKIT